MIDLHASREAAAPAEAVFDQARRFRNFANQARQNGARVRRREPDPETGRGLRWDVLFSFRGLQREFTLELLERRPPDLLRFAIDSPTVEGTFRVDFIALDRERCRVNVALTLQPRTLRARLVMQGLRLSHGRMERGLQRRLAAALARAEAAHAQEQAQG